MAHEEGHVESASEKLDRLLAERGLEVLPQSEVDPETGLLLQVYYLTLQMRLLQV